MMSVRCTRFLWVCTPVVAQDLFLAPSNDFLKLLTHQPERSSQIGCDARDADCAPYDNHCHAKYCDGGDNDEFDHWNHKGFNGAISKLCFQVGAPNWSHSKDWITGGEFCYAGQCLKQGCGAPSKDCFSFLADEAIAELTATACKADHAAHVGISSLTIKTTAGRIKKWGNRECRETFTLTPPEGKHITSFYGRASNVHAGWGGLFCKIGVYYDGGIASGHWKQIAGGPGVQVKEFKQSSCTQLSSSTSFSITNEWSKSTYSEITRGFEFDGGSSGKKESVTETFSRSVTAHQETSFETKDCREVTQTCEDGMHYAHQFVFVSNFNRKGDVTTFTNHWVCSNSPEICCLPGHFKNPTDASEGCVDGSPNVCE